MSSDGASGNVTFWLKSYQSGDAAAAGRVFELVYAELIRLSESHLRKETPGHSYGPSDLVQETVRRLLKDDTLAMSPNRKYLLGAASLSMRRLLVDHARRRKSQKREGKRTRVPLDDALDFYENNNIEIEALHEALEQLGASHERAATVVDMRVFGQMTIMEVARELDTSESTVEADIRFAKAWLRKRIGNPSVGL